MALYLSHKDVLYNAFFTKRTDSMTLNELRDYYQNLWDRLYEQTDNKYIFLDDDLDKVLEENDIFGRGINRFFCKEMIRLEELKKANKHFSKEVRKVLESNYNCWGGKYD